MYPKATRIELLPPGIRGKMIWMIHALLSCALMDVQYQALSGKVESVKDLINLDNKDALLYLHYGDAIQ